MKKEKRYVRSARDAVSLLERYAHSRQERFGIICLDSGYRVIGVKCLFIGSSNKCMVDPKMVFWEACRKQASAIILFHNHPSWNCTPSDEDKDLTRAIRDGGKLLNIQILDHVIVAPGDHYSFLENEAMTMEDEDYLIRSGKKEK